MATLNDSKIYLGSDLLIENSGGGGDTPTGRDVGAMYESVYENGAWSDSVELADNTVAEISGLKALGTGNNILGEYWDYTGILTLTLTFKYESGLSSSLYNNPIAIQYVKDGYGHSVTIHVENNTIGIASAGNPTKQLVGGNTYTIKCSLDSSNNTVYFYCKEEGVDNDFVLIDTYVTNYAYSYSPLKRIQIQNYLMASNDGPFSKFADFDLSDITIDVDGEVIFSRAKSGSGGGGGGSQTAGMVITVTVGE